MAEENDQNAVQPQNDEQQTVPMPSVDAEQTQTYAGEPYAAESATEPIDVQGGIEDQPTAAMPVANDGASAESAAAAGDTPDYASGGRANVPWLAVPRRMRRPSSTVRHRNMVRTVPCRRSRLMAPQPRTILRMVRRTCLRSRNMARTGRLPDSSRSGLAILSSGIRMWVEISRTISRIRNRITAIHL